MLFSSEYKIVLYFLVMFAPESDGDTRSKNAANASIEDIQVKFSRLLASIAKINEEKPNSLKRHKAMNKHNVASETLRQDDGQRKDRVIAIDLSTDNNVKPINSSVEIIYKIPTSKSEEILGVRSRQKKRHSDKLDSKKNIKPKLRTNIGNIFIEGKEKQLSNETRKPETNITNENIKKVAEDNGDRIEKLNLAGDANIDSKDVLRKCHKCSKKAVKKCKQACKSAYKSVCDRYKCSSNMKRFFGKTCKNKCRDTFDD